MDSLGGQAVVRQHWVSSRLSEPWDAPTFGMSGKLNKEARALARALDGTNPSGHSRPSRAAACRICPSDAVATWRPWLVARC
jgi:hypothetical protein